MNGPFLIHWKTGWVASPFLSLLLNFLFYEEIQSSPLEMKQEETQELLALLQASCCAL